MIVEGMITPIKENGAITGTVCYLRDITKQVKQDKHLKIAMTYAQVTDRARSDFLATINHEFRSAVSTISAYCDSWEMSKQEEKEKIIENIRAEGDKLLVLLSDILDVSKKNPEDIGDIKVPVNLKELFQELQRIFSGSIKKKKILLNTKFNSQIPIFISDYKALRHIFMQLLSYSFSIANKGCIDLSVTWNSRNLIIEISVQAKIHQTDDIVDFQMYQQLCERLNARMDIVHEQNKLLFQITLRDPEISSNAGVVAMPALTDNKERPKKDVVLIVDDISVNLK